MPRVRPCDLLMPPITHQKIIAAYKSRHAQRLHDELAWFSEKQPLRDVIVRVTAARYRDGTKLSHQHRLPEDVLEQANMALQGTSKAIHNASSFDELFNLIAGHYKKINGAGPVYTYDTALRLGAFLSKEPCDVYLHAGAREGAERLLRRPLSSRHVSLGLFSPAFLVLKPMEMENLLCCFRECI